MLDFKEGPLYGNQIEQIRTAFKEAWKVVKDVPSTRDTEHRYQLTLQHPEMRQRFLDGCIRNDFYTNKRNSLVVVDREFRALNILSRLHLKGDL